LAGIVAASERGVGGVEDSLAAARVIAGAEGDDDAEYEAAKSGGGKKAEKAREEFPGAAARARARARARLGATRDPVGSGKAATATIPLASLGDAPLGDAPELAGGDSDSPRASSDPHAAMVARRAAAKVRELAAAPPLLGAAKTAAAEAPRSSALFFTASPAALGVAALVAAVGVVAVRRVARRLSRDAALLASSAERAPLVAGRRGDVAERRGRGGGGEGATPLARDAESPVAGAAWQKAAAARWQRHLGDAFDDHAGEGEEYASEA